MKVKRIKPTKNKVFVKLDEVDTVVGSMIIPETERREQNTGTITAVGLLNKDEYSIKAGDRVLFHSNSGIRIEIDGDDYIVMKIDEIFSII